APRVAVRGCGCWRRPLDRDRPCALRPRRAAPHGTPVVNLQIHTCHDVLSRRSRARPSTGLAAAKRAHGLLRRDHAAHRCSCVQEEAMKIWIETITCVVPSTGSALNRTQLSTLGGALGAATGLATALVITEGLGVTFGVGPGMVVGTLLAKGFYDF